MLRGKNLVYLSIVLLLAGTAVASEITTTDSLKNPQNDFSPEELVYFDGKDFSELSLIILEIIKPDFSEDVAYTTTDSFGKFFLPYDFGGQIGLYRVLASDGINFAQTTFTDAAIWTTDVNCGSQSQDTNHFSIGENVYINGDGFTPGSYSWEIKGKPGGASCDPNTLVASGTKSVNASGEFCINAYTVMSDDCGEYQVKFSNKGDNYRVEGNTCSNDLSCGTASSTLICQNNDVYNLTEIPSCVSGACQTSNSTTLQQDCGTASSILTCLQDDLINLTTTPSCSLGACTNSTSVTIIQTCQYGCFNGACNPCASDEDSDGICDSEDSCPDTSSNIPVDSDGCSQIQFCKSASACGPNCENADWLGNNNTNAAHPLNKDCTVAIKEVEGKLYPTCTAVQYMCRL